MWRGGPCGSHSWPAFGTSTPSGPRHLTRREPSMVLSAPLEQTLPEPPDRPMEPPSRRIARIAGIFMVITFISIPALLLYNQVLHHTNFVLGDGGGGRRGD